MTCVLSCLNMYIFADVRSASQPTFFLYASTLFEPSLFTYSTVYHVVFASTWRCGICGPRRHHRLRIRSLCGRFPRSARRNGLTHAPARSRLLRLSLTSRINKYATRLAAGPILWPFFSSLYTYTHRLCRAHGYRLSPPPPYPRRRPVVKTKQCALIAVL